MLINDKEQARLISIYSADCHILAKWAEHDLPDTNAADSAANSRLQHHAMQVPQKDAEFQYAPTVSQSYDKYLPKDLRQPFWLRQIWRRQYAEKVVAISPLCWPEKPDY